MIIPSSLYFKGNGVVSLAPLSPTDGSYAGPFLPLGNVPSFEVQPKVDLLTHRESMSGLNIQDLSISKGMDVGYKLDIESFSAANWALLTAGNVVSNVSITPVTGKVLPGSATAMLAIGAKFDSGACNLTAVALKDSTGSPKTLVSGTNYDVDLATGVITLLDITTGGPYVGPLKVDYTPAAYTSVGLLTQAMKFYALLFEGMNTATNKREKRLLYRISLPPADAWPFIEDTQGKASFSGGCMPDPTKPSNAALGQYGEINLP